jgi:hypothetical protein
MRSFSVEETISKDSVASEGNVFNILAGTVSRTLTGALSALTSLATITLKALTLSNVTVTNSLTSTLRILVELSTGGRCVNPGKLKGTNTLGTITRV